MEAERARRLQLKLNSKVISDIFDNLKIAKHPDYKKHLNQYKVIQINFSEMPDECESYKAYILRVHKLLKRDLQELYPQLNLDFEDATKDLLNIRMVRSVFQTKN